MPKRLCRECKFVSLYTEDNPPCKECGGPTVMYGNAHREAPGGHSPACWPMVSEAAGVHPKNIKVAMQHAREHGVPTEFTEDGRAIFTSRQHRKRYCELPGVNLYDRNGGDGDPGRNHAIKDDVEKDMGDI